MGVLGYQSAAAIICLMLIFCANSYTDCDFLSLNEVLNMCIDKSYSQLSPITKNISILLGFVKLTAK